jgi:phage tail-like protein
MERTYPLQTGRFRIEIGGAAVAHFQDCSGLTMEIEILEHQEGGNNDYVHKLPGRVKWTNITFKRGVTDDDAFLKWRPSIEGGKIVVERKNLTIALLAHDGTAAKMWTVREAYPVKYTGPDMRASSMDTAIETLELAHTGWNEV